MTTNNTYSYIRKITFLLIILPFVNHITAQNTFSLSGTSSSPKFETRAVWITTLNGMDWPRNKATEPEGIKRQKEELCKQLDELKKANFNTILLQTRLRNDVIYPSKIEMFSEEMTGKMGKDPGYDPLAFAIEECHKRGMEIHAWVVAIPLGSDRIIREMGKNSITKKHREMCIHYNRYWYLDPGHPETKKYLSSIVEEIISNYDIDGINLDYIRYPDRSKRFPDQRSFRKYGKGKSLAQWRRDNITDIVREVYKTVKQHKPWVKVGSSPLGKYDDLTRYSSKGWNAYNTVYQEAQDWLKEGIQDIVLPMLYYREENFYPFALDWQENSNGRTVVPGLGIYFLDPKEGNWTLQDAKQQIYFTRCAFMEGQAYFRARFLLDNIQGLFDELKNKTYTYPSLIQPMKWMDSIPPTSPSNIQIISRNDSLIITWETATDNSLQETPNAPAIRYNIYASKDKNIDITNPKNIKATYLRNTQFAIPAKEAQGLNFTVTAVDCYGNESIPVSYETKKKKDCPLPGKKAYIDIPYHKDGIKIVITDLFGRNIYQTSYTRTLKIKSLKPGVYYIYIKDKKDNTLERIPFTH